jgi:hypothetical protein
MARISKNEIVWLHGQGEDGNLKYIITSNIDRSWYYIYDKDYQKLGKAKTPTELEKKYFNIE